MGRTTFGGEFSPEPSIIQKEADACKRYLIIHFLRCNIYIRKDKSSRLTDNTLSISEEPLHSGGHFGHLHKVVLIEPPNVLLIEVAGDSQNSLALQLGCLTRMDKVTICVDALLSLASEVGAIFSGMSLGNTLEGLIFGFFK